MNDFEQTVQLRKCLARRNEIFKKVSIDDIPESITWLNSSLNLLRNQTTRVFSYDVQYAEYLMHHLLNLSTFVTFDTSSDDAILTGRDILCKELDKFLKTMDGFKPHQDISIFL